jgi:glutamyl-tRNA reductase
VAIELAQQLFAKIQQARAVVIGAGQMGELLVKHLRHVTCQDITVINRTHCRARSMAQNHGVQAAPWEDLEKQLLEADIVIGSAAGEDYLFDKATFQGVMKRRVRRKTLLVIDIAVPRNFEPAINDLDNVYLFSVDDLSEVVETNQETRKRDVAVGLDIVAENAADFMEWFEVRDLGPQIGELKAVFTKISEKELQRFFVGERQNARCRKTLEPMVNRVTNKFVYCLVKHINRTAKEQGTRQAARIVEQLKQQAAQIAAEDRHEEVTES